MAITKTKSNGGNIQESRRSFIQYAIRDSQFAVVFLLLSGSLLAGVQCPVTGTPKVIVQAPLGNLIVDTTGTDAADVDVTSNQIELKQTCGRDEILFSGIAQPGFIGTVDWKIRVPKGVELDITVQGAGNITLNGDSDGKNVTLRTAGGAITAGNIRGNATLITQAGSIRAGNIDGKAELRSDGGAMGIQVGDVKGTATFWTRVGAIGAGVIEGSVVAETGGGNISIRGARGSLLAKTEAGNITINDARQINANSGGGNIISQRVRGTFWGRTESGDIIINEANSSVEAYVGAGKIVVTLRPGNLGDDLHMKLQAAIGDITVYLPPGMKAALQATADKGPMNSRIVTEFPAANAFAPASPLSFGSTQAQTLNAMLNGGGSPIVNLHTSQGRIQILKIKIP